MYVVCTHGIIKGGISKGTFPSGTIEKEAEANKQETTQIKTITTNPLVLKVFPHIPSHVSVSSPKQWMRGLDSGSNSLALHGNKRYPRLSAPLFFINHKLSLDDAQAFSAWPAN